MSKKCIYCGAELPDSASFCPSCAHSQTVRKELKPPRRWWKKAKIFAFIVVVVAAAALIFTQYRELKTYEGGAEVVYSDNGKQYHVLLSFARSDDGIVSQPIETLTQRLPTGATSGIISRLYIYEEGNYNENGSYNNIQSEFMEKVLNYQVSVLPQDGAEQMDYATPGKDTPNSYGAIACGIDFWAECGTNDIVWTLNMKNGDTIILRQQIRITLVDTIEYRPETTPMETIEDLQALFTRIKRQVIQGATVNIYLPPVTYAGGLHLDSRAVTIYGSTEGNTTTTFTGESIIETEDPDLTTIKGVRFEGSGGVGISATTSLTLYDCFFSGWDTAAFSRNGTWISAHDSTFDGNGVGLHFASQRSDFVDLMYDGNRFLNNGTGVIIEDFATRGMLKFNGSLFSGNSVDIQNTAEVSIDTAGATFE